MSDVMLFGVLRMPFEQAMSDDISRLQFYNHAQEAVDRIEELERTIEKMADPRLAGMTVHENMLEIGINGGACQILAAAFAEQFKSSSAFNYLEVQFNTQDSEIGPLLVTVQRQQGKTAHQLRKEAEAKVEELERKNAELHKAVENLIKVKGRQFDATAAQQKDEVMDDRRLLELAAKAIGMHVLPEGEPWTQEEIGWFFNQVGDHPPALYERKSKGLKMWAPLTDDGDALRLAAKLNIEIRWRLAGEPRVTTMCAADTRIPNPMEPWGDDKLAATRRAIVRAAAAIGKRMEG